MESDSPWLRVSGNPAMARLPNPFTVVTWNIERGKRFESILNALNTSICVDLRLLQEVDRHARRTSFRDVATELAAGAGTQQVFGVEFLELAQGRPGIPAEHGNSIQSLAKLANPRFLRFEAQPCNWGRFRCKVPLLQPREGGRIALIAELTCANRTIAVYNTHLESRTDDEHRAEQMSEILDDIRTHYSSSVAVLIGGDWNTRDGIDSKVCAVLARAGFEDVFRSEVAPETTKPGKQRRLDWIFTRGLTAIGSYVPKLKITDHYPVIARLELKR